MWSRVHHPPSFITRLIRYGNVDHFLWLLRIKQKKIENHSSFDNGERKVFSLQLHTEKLKISRVTDAGTEEIR